MYKWGNVLSRCTLLQSPTTARNRNSCVPRCFEVWHRDYNGITGERTSTHSNWLIEKLYQLDKASGFRGDESHEPFDFTKRLASGQPDAGESLAYGLAGRRTGTRRMT
jgi:hypothetical protein